MFFKKQKQRVEKIESLQNQVDFHGILDDRGRFVYITNSQMQELADWMKKKFVFFLKKKQSILMLIFFFETKQK